MSNDEILGQCYRYHLESQKRTERARAALDKAVGKLRSAAQLTDDPDFRADHLAPYHDVVNTPEFVKLQDELSKAVADEKMAALRLSDATR